MSVLACITVHSCDGCRRIVCLKTDAEYKEFERSWYDGFKVDYCNDCRDDRDNADVILADRALRSQIAASVDRINGTRHSSPVTDHSPEEAAYGH